jgi:hypothetical protein
MRGWALRVAPGEQAARWGQAAGRGPCHAEAPRPRKPRSCLAGASLRRGRAMQATRTRSAGSGTMRAAAPGHAGVGLRRGGGSACAGPRTAPRRKPDRAAPWRAEAAPRASCHEEGSGAPRRARAPRRAAAGRPRREPAAPGRAARQGSAPGGLRRAQSREPRRGAMA